MIYDLTVAWRNLRSRPIEVAVPILVVSLAIALSVAVFALSDGAEEGIVQASDPFGMLVVGSAGSGQELVLSSVLLQGNPIGNISYDVYEALESDDARVQLVVPLAFGDSLGGARLIGTNLNFFELRTSQLAPPAFQLAEGRFFAEFEAADHDHDDEAVDDEHDHDDEDVDGEHNHDDEVVDDDHDEEAVDDDHDHDDEAVEEEHDHDDEAVDDEHDHDNEAIVAEAVLGSQVAARTGLSIGDRFFGTHGVGAGIAENVHENIAYEIVGILEPSGTAYDTAIYIPLEAVWFAHEEGHDHEEHELEALSIEAAAEQAAAPINNQVTSVLVLPTGFVEQNQLAQQFYLDPTLQAAFPGEELGNLINLLNQGQQVLEVVGYLVLVIAALTLFLSMYSEVLARQQSIAIMRGVGSSRLNIARIIIFETLIVSISGAILGRLIGYGVAAIVALVYSTQSAIPIPIRFLPELEVILWVLSIGVGILAGLIPALMAYRVDVVERLFPS